MTRPPGGYPPRTPTAPPATRGIQPSVQHPSRSTQTLKRTTPALPPPHEATPVVQRIKAEAFPPTDYFRPGRVHASISTRACCQPADFRSVRRAHLRLRLEFFLVSSILCRTYQQRTPRTAVQRYGCVVVPPPLQLLPHKQSAFLSVLESVPTRFPQCVSTRDRSVLGPSPSIRLIEAIEASLVVRIHIDRWSCRLDRVDPRALPCRFFITSTNTFPLLSRPPLPSTPVLIRLETRRGTLTFPSTPPTIRPTILPILNAKADITAI